MSAKPKQCSEQKRRQIACKILKKEVEQLKDRLESKEADLKYLQGLCAPHPRKTLKVVWSEGDPMGKSSWVCPDCFFAEEEKNVKMKRVARVTLPVVNSRIRST